MLSCNSGLVQIQDSKKDISFTESSEAELKDQILQIDRNLEKFQLESEWLKQRNKIVNAEIVANESLKSLTKLEIELSKFQLMQKNFPDQRGFISDLKEVEWKSLLKVKKDNVEKSNALVRLLKRDMHDLEAKLHRKGFKSASETIVKN